MPKTLDEMNSKHISWDKDGVMDEIVKTRDLKDEAIEWIKYWMNENNDSLLYGGSPMISGRIKAFKEFFNITEEDLK